MHARLISFSGADPEKRETALQTIRETVIPTLRGYDGFLTFHVREDLRAIHVRIEAPETARDAADEVFAPFLPRVSEPKTGDCRCCRGTS